MHKIQTILDGIQERLSSPLLFSFVLSWLIVNWKIFIMLFWFNDEVLLSEDPFYHLKFVQDQFSAWTLWQLPLLSALIYTFLFPLLKQLISSYQAIINKYGSQLRLKASGGTMVSIDRYMEKAESLNQKEKFIEKLISNESKALQEKDEYIASIEEKMQALIDDGKELMAEKRESVNELSNVQQQCQDFEEAIGIKPFEGSWTVTIENRKAEWNFSNHSVLEIDPLNFHRNLGSIEHGYWHKAKSNRVILMITLADPNDPLSTIFKYGKIQAILTSNNRGDNLVGKSVEGIDVQLKRIES